jgi:hypothetical protein
MGSVNGSTSNHWKTPELLAVAVETDPTTTERTLEYWRNQGLLPHAERRGQDGKRPVWDYPPETSDQLRALLRLREQTKDPNLLRAALWYDGHAIETARVRGSIGSHLRQVRDTCEKELAKNHSGPAGDPAARWEAIQAVARVLARKRSQGFPRLNRQSLAERSAGIALTLGLLLGEGEAMRHLEADAPAVERLIGVDHGRRFRPNGVGPWLDGPAAEGLEGFSKIGSLDRLIEVVEGATDENLEAARGFAKVLLGGISAFSRIADALAGRDNASGMAGMRIFDGDPHEAVFVVPLVLSILGSTELAQNLGQVVGAIQTSVEPIEQQARELVAMTEEERDERMKNLSQLPFAEQLRIKRLMAEFAEPTN